jgi:hypothetical protein
MCEGPTESTKDTRHCRPTAFDRRDGQPGLIEWQRVERSTSATMPSTRPSNLRKSPGPQTGRRRGLSHVERCEARTQSVQRGGTAKGRRGTEPDVG